MTDYTAETVTDDCVIIPDKRQTTITAYLHSTARKEEQNRITSIVHLVKTKGAISESFNAYILDCAECNSCKPIRTSCLDFHPSRSQRSALNKNSDLKLSIEPAHIDNEKFILYQTYMQKQHPSSEMNDKTFDELRLQATGNNKMAVLANPQGKVLAYTLLQLTEDAIVAEYTVYDYELSKQRSLGTLMDLRLLQYGLENDIPYFYTGAINLESKELKHKGMYKASEIFDRATEAWVPIPRNPTPQDLEFNG